VKTGMPTSCATVASTPLSWAGRVGAMTLRGVASEVRQRSLPRPLSIDIF
jgi:hypothetical protein